MKILIDENVPKSIYIELKRRGYDVKHVIYIKRGLKDKEIIELSNKENRVIVTFDEDFVYLRHLITTKVILIRWRFRKEDVKKIVDILEKLFKIEGRVIILREDYIQVFE